MTTFSRKDFLEIYVLPVSGGGFPAQLQQLIFLYNERQLSTDTNEDIGDYQEYIPDICLGASGGNVSAYIGLSGNWSEGGIKRVVQTLNSKMFSQTWWPGPMAFLPTWILGIFEGALFKPGYGPSKLFKAFSDSSSIQDVELWTGTFNKTQKRSQFFCNKKKDDCYITETYNTFTFKTMPLTYMNGDIDYISKVSVASASVPVLFKPVALQNAEGVEEEFIDGGITYPSPLTPLQEKIYKIMKPLSKDLPFDYTTSVFPVPVPSAGAGDVKALPEKKLLHLYYFSPYNMDNTTEKVSSTLGSDSFLSYMTDASAIKDRYTGINLLERIKGEDQTIDVKDSRKDPELLQELLTTYRDTHYFCFIYVLKNDWIDMTNFTSADVLQKMNEAESQIEFYFWYVIDA
jgi:predicted acylesterase/phospholipase RssA